MIAAAGSGPRFGELGKRGESSMKRKLGMFAALLAVIVTGLVASGSASSGLFFHQPLCADTNVQVVFNQYGYYDGRTYDQMQYILHYGDPNGAVVNGVWVQQLSPGVFADYVGPDPYAPGAYAFHSVRAGLCVPPRVSFFATF
jgi:hypothetical protein